MLLYDEHGGFYDHVPPPPAVRPDAEVARPSGFAFDRLGVRVPAILVSPWLPGGHADHTVYDHASLPATLKKMLSLPSFLTARDAAANTFEHNFLATARAVPLTNLGALVGATAAGGATGGQLSSHQRSLLVLAEVLASPPSGARVAADAVVHARAMLDSPQGP